MSIKIQKANKKEKNHKTKKNYFWFFD